jgi:DNA-binding IclR family transcriptional regulator
MVYIEKLESPSAVRMSSRIGASVFLHSTAVGKAYLAALDDDACAALLAGLPSPLPCPTKRTTVEPAALRAQIAEARARGWAMDNEENEAGIHCFGAAIRNAQGRPVAAISVSTLLFRQKADPQSAYVEPLLEACRIISQRVAQAPSLSDGEAL